MHLPKRSISGLWVSEWQLSCGQIHSPWLGDIVDFGIRLSYRPASLCSLAGRHGMPVSTFFRSQGLWIWQLVTRPQIPPLTYYLPPPPPRMMGEELIKGGPNTVLHNKLSLTWGWAGVCPWPLLFKYEQLWALPSIIKLLQPMNELSLTN